MIFLDNASTTKPYDEVVKTINDVNDKIYYNPSALYGSSVEVNGMIEKVRSKMLTQLGANFFDALIYTSGATESNNFALRGALKKNGKLLVSMGEHPSVFNTAKQLLNEGYAVEFISLNKDGTINLDDMKTKLVGATVVSVIHVNNETGAINNIKEIVNIIKSHDSKILVHSDGVQAFGKIPVNINNLGVDMYTISSHKIHGPKGVGALYVKSGVNLKPLIYGGEQEKSLRAGTQNVSGILGFAKASEIVCAKLKENYKHVLELKIKLYECINIHNETLKNKIYLLNENLSGINVLKDNVELFKFSPYINVVSVPNIKSETILHFLEEKGILLGNGSACSSRHSDNRVLSFMRVDRDLIDSAIRISFSEFTTIHEVETFVNELKNVIENYLI